MRSAFDLAHMQDSRQLSLYTQGNNSNFVRCTLGRDHHTPVLCLTPIEVFDKLVNPYPVVFSETYLSIKCKPEAVSTTWLTSPGLSWKAASSNSFCMSPLPKKPRSPIFLALLQSDSLIANSPRVACPLRIRASWPRIMLMASSFVRVISDWLAVSM